MFFMDFSWRAICSTPVKPAKVMGRAGCGDGGGCWGHLEPVGLVCASGKLRNGFRVAHGAFNVLGAATRLGRFKSDRYRNA